MVAGRWLGTAAVVTAGVLTACPSGDLPDGSAPAASPTRDAAPTATPAIPSAPPAPVPSRVPAPSATVVREPFDADRALAFATALTTEVGARPAGGPADVAARERLSAALRTAGWSVEQRPFPLPQGGDSANVVAWLRDGPSAGPHVVVGAHLDTVAGSPGANDNASGVGVLVALAEELADERPAVPVVLVGFGAEEYQPSEPRRHHLGSEAYAAEHAGRVVAALSVDMIADGDTTCICWFAAGPDVLARRLDALSDGAGYEVRSPGDVSDHGPFARRGVPAALLWTGRDGRYHTAQDTPEHLDVEDIRRAGDLVVRFVRDLRPGEREGLEPG